MDENYRKLLLRYANFIEYIKDVFIPFLKEWVAKEKVAILEHIDNVILPELEKEKKFIDEEFEKK